MDELNSGFDASFAELFVQAKWILTPQNIENGYIEKLVSVIEQTGALPMFMTPDEHDKAAALISHMPMLVSQALVKTAKENANAIKIASSGFRDMTRLAMSNTTMANDMITLNRENIIAAYELLTKNLKELLGESYLDEIEAISEFRRKMYNKEGKNISN